VAVALSVAAAAQTSAGASTSSLKSLAKDLLPSSYAHKAGFTKVVEKVTTISKTGDKPCPYGAQEAFANASSQVGLVSEALACSTADAAAALLTGARSGTSATGANPPKQLGASAIERSSDGSTYAIYWQRGATLEVVGLNTDVPASGSTSTSTTLAAPPITRAQQKVLSSAALEQNTRLR
jgi:hypothetical protein